MLPQPAERLLAHGRLAERGELDRELHLRDSATVRPFQRVCAAVHAPGARQSVGRVAFCSDGALTMLPRLSILGGAGAGAAEVPSGGGGGGGGATAAACTFAKPGRRRMASCVRACVCACVRVCVRA